MGYLDENSKGIIDLDTHKEDNFSVGDYQLTFVLDDVILVEYLDTADGTTIKHGAIHIPTAHVQKAWRIGRILLAGPKCSYLTEGDIICFPGDKGLPASNINICSSFFTGKAKMVVFLNEGRVFGKLKKPDVLPEVKKEE